jgi:hypothetical protein
VPKVLKKSNAVADTPTYREGSIIAQLFDALSGGKQVAVKDLEKQIGKGRSISAPLARLKRHGKSGRMLRKWDIMREDDKVRMVVKSATKPRKKSVRPANGQSSSGNSSEPAAS